MPVDIYYYNLTTDTSPQLDMCRSNELLLL